MLISGWCVVSGESVLRARSAAYNSSPNSLMRCWSMENSLAVLQEVEAGPIEQVAMLDHDPMPAAVDKDKACILAMRQDFERSFGGAEFVVAAPEAKHRAGDF